MMILHTTFPAEQQVICCKSTVLRLANEFQALWNQKKYLGDLVQAMKIIQQACKLLVF
jgi:hypothetical protein